MKKNSSFFNDSNDTQEFPYWRQTLAITLFNEILVTCQLCGLPLSFSAGGAAKNQEEPLSAVEYCAHVDTYIFNS